MRTPHAQGPPRRDLNMAASTCPGSTLSRFRVTKPEVRGTEAAGSPVAKEDLQGVGCCVSDPSPTSADHKQRGQVVPEQ